jgi:hypothetical protein
VTLFCAGTLVERPRATRLLLEFVSMMLRGLLLVLLLVLLLLLQ